MGKRDRERERERETEIERQIECKRGVKIAAETAEDK